MTQELILEIESMAHSSSAISHHDGKVIFVDNVCPGDEIKAEIYDDRGSFAYAHATEITKESDLRETQPPCKLHKICGGCQWQQINYQEQLFYKRQNIIDLIRKAKLENPLPSHSLVKEVIGMEEPWRFRNKISYPVENKKSGRLVAGYFKSGTNELVNIKHCPVQYQIFDQIMEELKELCSQEKIGKPLLRHICLRSNHSQSELLCTFIIREEFYNEKKEAALQKLFSEIMQKFPQIKGTALNFNDNSTNVLFGEKSKIVFGKAVIEDQIGEIKYLISPNSFFQINNSQFAKIIDLLKQEITEIQTLKNRPLKILDAYCGVGTLSLPLAKALPETKIEAIELNANAIKNAKANCEINEIHNINFEAMSMENYAKEIAENKKNFDVIINNPPRKGSTKKVLEAFNEISPEYIFYISCNPASLSRDLKILEGFGYQALKIQPVDMFPHTFHCETFTMLVKVDNHGEE